MPIDPTTNTNATPPPPAPQQHSPTDPRFITRTDGETKNETPKVNTAEAGFPVDPTDPLTSGRSPKTGSQVAKSDLKPDSLVTWGGMQVQVSALVARGILTGNDRDGYKVADQPKASPTPKPATAPVPMEAFDSGLEEIATKAAQMVSMQGQVASIEEWAKTGQFGPKSISRFVSETGARPEEVKATLDQLSAGFDNQAASTLGKYGDPSAVKAWAEKHASNELADARRTHAKERTTAGYNAIGQRYLEALDTTPEGRMEILAAERAPGLEAIVMNGRVVLRHPSFKGDVSWSQAIKQGLIKPNTGKGIKK